MGRTQQKQRTSPAGNRFSTRSAGPLWRLRFRGLRLSLTLFGVLLFAAPTWAVPPPVDLHQITWYVHVDLIDAGAGRDLAYWQAILDEGMAEATRLLEGEHGPWDSACCTRIERSVALTTFGSPGDLLDVVDTQQEIDIVTGVGGSGSRAMLVDSLNWCGGSAPNSIGCGLQPSFCDGNGGDDPARWMVLTVDAFDANVLSSVIAHERGHNACLGHTNPDECHIMRASGPGACVTASDCVNFQAARTTTSSGQTCGCLDSLGGSEDDGEVCTEVANGICSGGLCGDLNEDAGIELISSGGPESANGEETDDAIAISGLNGDWTTRGEFTVTSDEVQAMAYARDSQTLYGVIPTNFDDSIVTIDVETGSVITTVGSIANGSREIIAMAYNPGPTGAPGDDLLYVLETDGTFEDLEVIDPDSPSSTILLAPLALGGPDGFRGLAFDSDNQRLYTSSPFNSGLYEIDLASCASPPFCELAQVLGSNVPRYDASLTWSQKTGRLYLIGTRAAIPPLGERTFYNWIDPVTLEKSDDRNIDSFTPSGLAAIPVPEPGFVIGMLVSVVALSGFGRRSH